jgi:hypothetical protein
VTADLLAINWCTASALGSICSPSLTTKKHINGRGEDAVTAASGNNGVERVEDASKIIARASAAFAQMLAFAADCGEHRFAVRLGVEQL